MRDLKYGPSQTVEDYLVSDVLIVRHSTFPARSVSVTNSVKYERSNFDELVQSSTVWITID